MTDAPRLGGEWHWLALEGGCEETAAPWPGPQRYFRCGRDLLRALVEHGRRDRGWRRIWVPSYFCPKTALTLEAPGVEVRAYRYAPGMDLPTGSPDFSSGDAVLAANLFGHWAQPGELPAGVDVVEDHSHDPWAPWALESTANFALASLRKTLPLPDGAVLWSPRAEPLPVEPAAASGLAPGAREKAEAMRAKARLLAGDPVSFDRVRALERAGASAWQQGVHGMSALSRELLHAFPVEDWRRRRTRNLAAALAEPGGEAVRLVTRIRSSAAPFSLAVSFASPEERARVERRLTSEGLWGVSLWPPADSIPGVGFDERRLADSLLSFPCDGRYDEAQMGRLMRAIVAAVADARSGERGFLDSGIPV